MKAFKARERGQTFSASSSAHELASQNVTSRQRRPHEGRRTGSDTDEDDDGVGSNVTARAGPSAGNAAFLRPSGQESSRPAVNEHRSDSNDHLSSGTQTPSHTLGSDDEVDDDDGGSFASSDGEGRADSRRRHSKQLELGTWHYLPLMFVVLPMVGGAVVGRGEAWRDLLVLGLVGYWVYWLIKTPWELYHASLHHSLLAPSTSSLKLDHYFYLLLTILSPLLGAFLLTLTRSTLTYIPSYLSPSSIRLFLLAALIKPISNLVSLLQNRTEHLKSSISAPKHDEAELLRRRLRGLEREVKVLRQEAASRREVHTLRADVYQGAGGLNELNKHVRRVERRAELGRLTLGERLELVQRGLLGLREEVEDDRERQGYQFGQWLLHVLRLSSSSVGGDHRAQLGAGGGKSAYLYSPAGLLTPKPSAARQLPLDDPLHVHPAEADDMRSPPRYHEPSHSLVHSLLGAAVGLVRTSVKLSFKVVFWPLLLGRWALGQALEVVRAV